MREHPFRTLKSHPGIISVLFESNKDDFRQKDESQSFDRIIEIFIEGKGFLIVRGRVEYKEHDVSSGHILLVRTNNDTPVKRIFFTAHKPEDKLGMMKFFDDDAELLDEAAAT